MSFAKTNSLMKFYALDTGETNSNVVFGGSLDDEPVIGFINGQAGFMRVKWFFTYDFRFGPNSGFVDTLAINDNDRFIVAGIRAKSTKLSIAYD